MTGGPGFGPPCTLTTISRPKPDGALGPPWCIEFFFSIFGGYLINMGWSLFTKNTYRKKKTFRDKLVKKIIAEHGMDERGACLSCLGQRGVAEYELARHPQGTKAKGLRRDYKCLRVADSRRRFGQTEERSSRLRRIRRHGKHAARLKSKRKLESMV